MTKLCEVKPLPGYRVWVRYADGAGGEVDLSHLAGRGVFALWNEPGEFEKVHIGPGGAVSWSEQVELCPDATYLKLTGKRPDEVLDIPELERASA
jgi:hypothetical protein